MKPDLIKLNVSDGVALVTMDAPPVNAQSDEFLRQIAEVFDRLNDMTGARAIVLTGAGKIFSAGGDLKEQASRSREDGALWAHFRLAREANLAIVDSRKPVIAAINGPALGGGLGLAVCCDILIASESAVVGLPEIDVGQMGGVSHLMRAFPYSLTRRLFLTGDRISGEELYRRGIVEACVPDDQLMPYAMDMARRLASKSPVAMRLAKQAIGTVGHVGFKDGYRFEQGLTAELAEHPDALEAMKAFIEKRPPRFTLP